MLVRAGALATQCYNLLFQDLAGRTPACFQALQQGLAASVFHNEQIPAQLVVSSPNHLPVALLRTVPPKWNAG
jgi:hypothetical protein